MQKMQDYSQGSLTTCMMKCRPCIIESGALTTRGLIDSSLATANKCLDILSSGKVNDPVLQANLFNQKGRCFMRKNQYKEAIDMGYQVINGGEKN
ncbi:MAG: hypothetical protein WDO71_22165 [Bacteroidota bacterium]